MATVTTSMAAAWRRGLLLAAVALGAWLAWAGSAQAAFGLIPDSFTADAFTQAGERETQAGKHPFDATTTFRLNRGPTGFVEGGLHDAVIDLPPGFSGNPQAAPTCPRADYAAIVTGVPGSASCPLASQVGIAHIYYTFNDNTIGGSDAGHPVYNLEPLPGKVATLGIPVLTVASRINVELDPANGYRLRTRAENVSQGLPVQDVRITLWGVPASRQHDDQRACLGSSYITVGQTCSVTSPERPFVSLPSDCSAGPLTTDIAVDSWKNRGLWQRDAFTTPTGVAGCERLAFEPSASMALSTAKPDAPSGLSVDLRFPQNDDASRLDVPPLRDAEVTLPEGLTVNPGSADGLEACTDAQLGLKTDSPIGCPNGSKIGTVVVTSPALTNALEGSAYLRTQNSDDPSSGEMFRMALVVEDPERGVLIKLPGSISANPDTGRITAKFRENPQLPVASVKLTLKSGPRAPLATPASCGDHAATTRLTAWSAHVVDRASSLKVDCAAGLGAFQPTFTAGTESPIAGSSSPFTLRIDKADGQSALDKVGMSLPQGLLAKLKGAVGERVGTARIAAGPGANPYWLSGPVFLEGAYGDAPFSLRVSVPVKAGPFDLGEVTVRQKIYVNRDDASVRVVSDPLPTIVKGVPARLQSLAVQIDRPGFVLNPTSCAPKQVGATLGASTGQTAEVSSRFQVGSCAALEFDPQLAMRVGTAKRAAATATGRTPSEMRDGGHPALSARLSMGSGRANNAKATVTLPKAFALDPDNANGLCEPADAAKDSCPASSIVGNASAVTPLIGGTVDGPVYFVRGERRDPKSGRIIKTLPRLFVPLRSSENPLLKIDLRASSAVDDDDRLVTTFDNLPDVPITTFDLNINGGKNGILVVSNTNACGSTQYADSVFTGHSNRRYVSRIGLDTACPLSVVKSSHSASALNLTLGGLAPGKVTVTGKGLSKKSKTIAVASPRIDDEDRSGTTVTVSPTTHTTVAVPIGRSARRALSQGRNVKVKVAVGFKARGAKKTTKITKTLVIHGKKK